MLCVELYNSQNARSSNKNGHISAFNLGFVKHKIGIYLQHGDGLIYVTVPHV